MGVRWGVGALLNRSMLGCLASLVRVYLRPRSSSVLTPITLSTPSKHAVSVGAVLPSKVTMMAYMLALTILPSPSSKWISNGILHAPTSSAVFLSSIVYVAPVSTITFFNRTS
jgi:hypothetical protein